jgi:hypothetical protein
VTNCLARPERHLKLAVGLDACPVRGMRRGGEQVCCYACSAASVLIMALAVIPVIGWIAVVSFVIYNISKAVDGLKSLISDVLTSVVIKVVPDAFLQLALGKGRDATQQ